MPHLPGIDGVTITKTTMASGRDATEDQITTEHFFTRLPSQQGLSQTVAGRTRLRAGNGRGRTDARRKQTWSYRPIGDDGRRAGDADPLSPADRWEGGLRHCHAPPSRCALASEGLYSATLGDVVISLGDDFFNLESLKAPSQCHPSSSSQGRQTILLDLDPPA